MSPKATNVLFWYVGEVSPYIYQSRMRLEAIMTRNSLPLRNMRHTTGYKFQDIILFNIPH